MNFGLWAVSILPAWLVIRHFGVGQDGTGSESQPESELGATEPVDVGKTAE